MSLFVHRPRDAWSYALYGSLDDPRLCPDADMLDGDPYPTVEDDDE